MREARPRVDVAGFTALRPLLFSVAYRILGQAAEAEDVVQEAWLRYARAGDEVRDLRAWLLKVVTRLSLDELGSARARREGYRGAWLPEPVLTGAGVVEDPLDTVERHELLSLGALTMLERLSPAERAVLVLREGLELSHQEIAAIVGVSEPASRQLLARARRHVAGSPAREAPSPETHRRLVDALRDAFEAGDAGALIALLREDAVAVTDGGGETPAALRPIFGRDRIVRFFAGVRAKSPAGLRVAVGEANGLPALLLHREGVLEDVLVLVPDAAGMIAEMLLVAAPSKLAYARRQGPRLAHG
jgi:RNA polymerase sigma-70 factor (ECF subfamily)